MISKDKQYRTRGGQEVRIYATDVGSYSNCVHGAIKKETGWDICSWRYDGRRLQCEEHKDDLVEVKPRHKKTVWFNAYEDSVHGFFTSREDADKWSVNSLYVGKNRIACIKVDLDFEEGEGL